MKRIETGPPSEDFGAFIAVNTGLQAPYVKPPRRMPPIGTPQYDSKMYSVIAADVVAEHGFRYPYHLEMIRDEVAKRRSEWSTTPIHKETVSDSD